MSGCEIRPDDRRSAAGHDGVDAEAPSVCCGKSGDDRRRDGFDGVDPRSGGLDGVDSRSGGLGDGLRGGGELRWGGGVLRCGGNGGDEPVPGVGGFGIGLARVVGSSDRESLGPPGKPGVFARVVGSSERESLGLPGEPGRRDDESSLTRELPPGSYVTTST
jgi:hypothetical protein